MKRYVLCCLLLFCILNCRAQRNVEEKDRIKFQLGAGLSVNTSWITGFDRKTSSTSYYTEESLDDPKIGMGFTILYFNYFASPRFSVSLSPQFDSYGARLKHYETVYHELGVSTYNRIITENLTYFQVPVTFNYYINSYLSINAGVYVSALIEATRNDPEKNHYTYYSSSSYIDVSQNYRDADLGFTAGAAVDIGRFKIMASYMHGGINISDIIDDSHYNRAVSLSLIVNFFNRK